VHGDAGFDGAQNGGGGGGTKGHALGCMHLLSGSGWWCLSRRRRAAQAAQPGVPRLPVGSSDMRGSGGNNSSRRCVRGALTQLGLATVNGEQGSGLMRVPAWCAAWDAYKCKFQLWLCLCASRCCSDGFFCSHAWLQRENDSGRVPICKQAGTLVTPQHAEHSCQKAAQSFGCMRVFGGTFFLLVACCILHCDLPNTAIWSIGFSTPEP
jgi:hypothetical protein